MITWQELHDNLEYRNGRFWWKFSKQGRKLDEPAGSLNGDGYRQINFKGKIYMEHRLVWLYVTGEWPSGFIDHINRDRSDNRFENLREASSRANATNTKASEARFLPTNVYRNGKGFVVTLSISGKRKTFPTVSSVEEAIEIRDKALWEADE